jgi:hypothetical protein
VAPDKLSLLPMVPSKAEVPWVIDELVPVLPWVMDESLLPIEELRPQVPMELQPARANAASAPIRTLRYLLAIILSFIVKNPDHAGSLL